MVIKIVFFRGKKVEVQGFREDRARSKKSWLFLIECTSEEMLWVAPTHLTTETNFNFWIDYEIIIAYCQDKSSPKDDQDFQYCLTVIITMLAVPYLEKTLMYTEMFVFSMIHITYFFELVGRKSTVAQDLNFRFIWCNRDLQLGSALPYRTWVQLH